MSAPIPMQVRHGAMDDSFSPGQLRMTPRGTHVPAFYLQSPHPNGGEGLVICDRGVPLLPKRTVADLPVERRWAVNMEGELLPEAQFTEGLRRIWHETYQLRGRSIPKGDRFEHTPQPDRVQYVSMKIDPAKESQLVPIDYDPDRTAGQVPQKLYSSDEDDEGEDRMTVLLRAYASPKLRAKLTDKERAEIERELGQSGEDGVARKLEALSRQLAAKEITPEAYTKQVAKITGAKLTGVSRKKKGPRPKKKPIQMACGEKVWAFHTAKHREACPVCAAGPSGDPLEEAAARAHDPPPDSA